MKKEALEINGLKYTVKVFYEDRQNSAASIGKNSINVRIPLFLDREERAREEFSLKLWARQKILENPDRHKPKVRRQYKDGDSVKVGNEEYKFSITFKEKQSSSARIVGNVICLTISSNLSEGEQNRHVSALLSRIIARKRLPGLKEKIIGLNCKHFNQSVNKIFFKNNRSNWGSCSKKGNINISTRLLFAPDDVLEYVCVHELAHLVEFNHSDRFWGLVESAVPDYREKERWLKENEHALGF